MRPVGNAKQLEQPWQRAIALITEGRTPVEVAQLVPGHPLKLTSRF
jgi:hypothetical protein